MYARFTPSLPRLAVYLLLGGAAAVPTHAQPIAHDHTTTTAQGSLIQAVRAATERFRDPTVAVDEGYAELFGCVSGPDAGAMGVHYANSTLINDDVLDVTKPEIVIYEPSADGRLRLIGADYLVFADVWHKAHPDAPQIDGQLLQYFESPNRFGLPAFYTLHVWAWKDNPNGAFVNWHPRVSCQGFRK